MRLFVKNLPPTTTPDDLAHLFAPYGTITNVDLPRDEETQRPRGWGHLDMPDGAEAQAAITGLHGQIVEGQPLIVTQAYNQGGQSAPRRETWRRGRRVRR